MFDHPDDDIYDGLLGEDDDEVPRINIDLIVEENETKIKKASTSGSSKQVAPPRPQASQEISAFEPKQMSKKAASNTR